MDDCFEEATNVYRTKHYIVEQVLGVDDNEVECAQLCSHDTFYRRTKKRDRKYAEKFGRQQADGKRIHVGKACEKEYID